MKRKFDFIEYFKTIILVVLFLITILLLYLCFNQHGRSFSIADIIPTRNKTAASVDFTKYTNPSYIVQSNGDGSFSISFENKERFLDATKECAQSLIASSTAKIEKVTEEEFRRKALEDKAFQAIFSFDVPFNDISTELTGKQLDLPEGFEGFNTILFADSSKECFYVRDSYDGYYKIVAGENYYSIDRLSREFVPNEKTLSISANIYNIERILEAYGLVPEIDILEVNTDHVAEAIFGDTFDFVRKITDSFGNETYMYGYGQKRLSVNIDGSIEFKEETGTENTHDFYTDLEAALNFIAKTVGLENNFMITRIDNHESPGGFYYRFTFLDGDREIIMDIYNSEVSYFYLSSAN